MRKLYLALAGAAALGMASAGNAAVVVNSTTLASLTGPTTTNSTTVMGFHETGLDNPFTETLTFTSTLAASFNVVVSTSEAGVNFTNVMLAGGGSNWGACGGAITSDCFASAAIGNSEFWSLVNPISLAADTAYTLTIQGTSNNTGVLSGNVTLNAVPEPATWGMLLLGFAAIGYQMRKRRRPALMQLA